MERLATKMNNLANDRNRSSRTSGLPRAVRVLTLAVAGFLVLPAFGESDAAFAKGIFEKRCTGCHTFGKGVKVGPDLKGVTDRHNRAWLLNFIRSSSSVIKSGDPAAVALFNQYKKERMPDWSDFTPEQIGAIIDYFAADGPAQKEPDERHANTATLAEIEGGRRLFQGKAPLSGGGSACVTCHSIRGGGWGRGGSLGPDLTATYFKYQDKALTNFLKHAHLAKSASGRDLTPQESFNLKAYMAKTGGLAIPAPGAAPIQTAQTGLSPLASNSPLASKRSYR
jgi:mono/diheme cytochrome c family protein